jgi:hypothetical protein
LKLPNGVLTAPTITASLMSISPYYSFSITYFKTF